MGELMAKVAAASAPPPAGGLAVGPAAGPNRAVRSQVLVNLGDRLPARGPVIHVLAERAGVLASLGSRRMVVNVGFWLNLIRPSSRATMAAATAREMATTILTTINPPSDHTNILVRGW